MRDGIGIEAELFHFLPGTLVIPRGCGIRQEKFRLTFGRISFHGHDNSGPDQDSVLASLGSDERAFLNAVAFTQLGGNDDCPAFTDFYRVHRAPYEGVSISECL